MKLRVVLHKDPDSDYGVSVPDLPGCFSAGATVTEALENLTEAMALHYEGLVADGQPLPTFNGMDVYIERSEHTD
jgi:predicted RNase H-like HicB family nuclease